jgi:glutamyl-tRNA synthetase
MKTRFAPSPTGYIHLGNARTALFSALLAKAQGGTFLLRIEDTDAARSTTEHAEQLQVDLRWLNCEWQEGPNVGGDNGPYFQAQRQAIYNKYYEQLEKIDQLYPCFCTEQQLAIARKVQLASGQPPRYSGACRHLTAEQVAQKQAQGLQPTLRFRVPDNQVIEFNDFVRGAQKYLSSDIGDFIIRRADGTAPFFFCNAIDDALMGVTHVLRGEDHLTNTPRQLMILQTLKLPLPNYGHLALILGHDGSPLSKRHGSRSIKELREEGYLAPAVINYLARLGHYYESNEFMKFDQLAKLFAAEHLGKSPARFDQAQLHYWQKQAVAHLTAEEFCNWISEETKKIIPHDKRELFISAVQNNVSFPADVLLWANSFFAEQLEYSAEVKEVLKNAGKNFFETALIALDQHGADAKKITQHISEKLNIKGKALFHPLRLALTGQSDGPELAKVCELLGIDRISQRLKNAQNFGGEQYAR